MKVYASCANEKSTEIKSSIKLSFLAIALTLSALFLGDMSTDAASCSSFVANSSYGNTGGYAYVLANTNCTASVYSTNYAIIRDAGGGWLSYATSTHTGTGFSTYKEGWFCATLSPAYQFSHTGAFGYLYPLWTC